MVELWIFSQGVSESPQLGQVPERLPGGEMDIGIREGTIQLWWWRHLTSDTMANKIDEEVDNQDGEDEKEEDN